MWSEKDQIRKLNWPVEQRRTLDIIRREEYYHQGRSLGQKMQRWGTVFVRPRLPTPLVHCSVGERGVKVHKVLLI